MTDLGTALEQRQVTPKQQTVLDLIQRQKPEIEKLLPTGVSFERFERVCRTEIGRNPKLFDCTASSLAGALMLSVQLGLEPGPLGHVYFVPFKTECVWILGYKGMTELAYRSGQVKDIAAGIVYAGDDFDFREGTRPFLDHRPAGPPGDREPTHFYAIARLRTGGAPFRVLFPEDIEAAQKRSPAGKRGEGPWITDWPAMARKTPIRRLASGGSLPLTSLLALALSADELPAPELGDEGLVLAAVPDEGGDDAA